MTKETMNVHKALTELKMLNKRINDAVGIRLLPYCVANRASNKKINGNEIKVYQEDVQSKYKSVTDLMTRRTAIKQAVVRSNAETIVKISGKEYTVAEAIEMKNHGLDHKKELLMALEEDYQIAVQKCNTENAGLEEKARNYILSMYGEKEKSAAKDHEEEITKYIEANTCTIIDPLGIEKIITDMRDEINNFRADVDAALSTSNALTIIEIEY